MHQIRANGSMLLGSNVTVIPSVAAKAKARDIAGIENFLPTAMDGIYSATPLVTTEGIKKVDVFNKFFDGQELDKVLSDLHARYNAALEKAKAAMDTTVRADPSSIAASLHGALVEK
ncbi:hypothetical protein [Paenibacillus apis]|uniref:Uncharacterized protein n=1 Tax=Paenibacillus apis TaxID=1792174 RepID=A0A920CI68_9BACL|nr:hypothetical protein [Paenibacillus apis]GIO40330.1 hypothetical protein J41TS4_00880 [Paenibacillus apis]